MSPSIRIAGVTWMFVTGLCFLTACGGNSVPELKKVEKKDVLVFLRSDISECLDPHATSSGADAFLIQQMYETLVQPSKKPPVAWEPCLAESWTISEDFKIYTFKLRRGVKFHDGSEFNAAAAKRSFERATNLGDPAAPPDLPYAAEYFGGIDKIETPDDFTLRLVLKDMNPKFLANCGLFASSIVSTKAINQLAKEPDATKRQTWLTTHPAGTGPYTLAKDSDYQDAKTITMTAFDGYWDGKPGIKRIAFQWNQDQKIRREQLVSGAVQMIDSPAGADWKDLQSNKDVFLYTWEAENICYLSLNCDAAKGFPTADVRVRKAIAMAIDRDSLVTLYEGTAKPQFVLLPPVTLGHPAGYRPPSDIPPRAQRLEKARALLKEAGAEKITLKLAHPVKPRPYLAKPANIGDLIKQQLAEIGITVELAGMEMAELRAAIPQGSYAMTLLGWMGETGEPDDFWRPLLSGQDRPSNNNIPRFWNKEVAEKIDIALKERDRAKREQDYIALEKWVHEEFRPMVPLLTAQQSMAWRSEIEGIYVDSTGVYRLHKAVYK